MTPTFEMFKNMVEPYKNTLVLDYFSVVRLVDVIEEEDDNYWVYDTKKGITHVSCVIEFITLKDKLDENDYKRLVYIWNLNNIEKAI